MSVQLFRKKGPKATTYCITASGQKAYNSQLFNNVWLDSMDFNQFLLWFEIAWRSNKDKISSSLKHRQRSIPVAAIRGFVTHARIKAYECAIHSL